MDTSLTWSKRNKRIHRAGFHLCKADQQAKVNYCLETHTQVVKLSGKAEKLSQDETAATAKRGNGCNQAGHPEEP